MDCPKCSFDCPPDFDFCPRCATPLQVNCPNCGFRAPADLPFCPKCAEALRHPASFSGVERGAQPVLEALREALGPEALEAALARGAELDLEQVGEEILAEG